MPGVEPGCSGLQPLACAVRPHHPRVPDAESNPLRCGPHPHASPSGSRHSARSRVRTCELPGCRPGALPAELYEQGTSSVRTAGVEPAVSAFGGRRRVHWTTCARLGAEESNLRRQVSKTCCPTSRAAPNEESRTGESNPVRLFGRQVPHHQGLCDRTDHGSRTVGRSEPTTGFEPATSTMARWRASSCATSTSAPKGEAEDGDPDSHRLAPTRPFPAAAGPRPVRLPERKAEESNLSQLPDPAG